MSWVPVERARAAALTIALYRSGVDGRPLCFVGISRDLLECLGWEPGVKVGVWRGEDQHARRILIVPGAPPLLGTFIRHKANKGGSLRLGHLPFLGGDILPKVPAEAAPVDLPEGRRALEIVLPPDWARPRTAAPPHPAAPPPPSPRREEGTAAASVPAVTRVGGITIDRTPGEENVSHDGRTMELTARQAHIVFLLTHAMPQPVPVPELLKKLWPSSMPTSAPTLLSASGGDLEKALPAVGLGLTRQRGVGWTLDVRA